MKRTFIISLFAILALAAMIPSASAMSSLANDFLKACRAVDSPWPPENWSKDDLRAASLEVLNAIEGGSYDRWPRDFCLKALGYVRNPDDLPRILAYKDTMNNCVLRSLKGFSHPDAIDFLLKYVTSEKPTKREMAIKGLAEIDFTRLDKPELWKSKVQTAIQKAYSKEKVSWLKKDIQVALDKIEVAKTA